MTDKPSIAVYTGSFDPFHLGHENMVRRASTLFDRLVIGVGENPEKKYLFSPSERIAMIREILADLPNVDVTAFAGLTVKFVKSLGARVVLRGIRALSDIEYEFTMSLTNRTLDPDIETVFLMASNKHQHLSSSLIRQIAEHGGDLSGFVPEQVIERLRGRYTPTTLA